MEANKKKVIGIKGQKLKGLNGNQFDQSYFQE